MWMLASFVLVLASAGSAQNSHKAGQVPSSFSIISIQVVGAHRFSAQDIIAASGLQVGQTAGEEDFQRAIQLLGETGAFRNVVYAYQFSGTGAKVELDVEEANKFAPAQFENFVWFSDADLLARVQASVPLFHGELPVSGGMADRVSDVLQSMLVEHNISGHVDYLREGADDSAPDGFLYSVTGPKLLITSVVFAGSGSEEQSQLEMASRPLLHQEYMRSLLLLQAQKVFLPVYLARGHLKASIAAPTAKVISENEGETSVQVTFPVTPGPQYKLAGITWLGNKVFPQDRLEKLLEVLPGKIADAMQLEKDLKAVQSLYGTRGYVAATVTPAAHFDDAAKTVAYDLQVREGAVYHMGDLEIRGVDSRTTTRMIEAWKLRGGDVYDASYVKEFLYQTRDWLPNGEWSTSVHESVDNKENVVDITIRFDPKFSR
jgi:outer membrane protein assembly factor BamA